MLLTVVSLPCPYILLFVGAALLLLDFEFEFNEFVKDVSIHTVHKIYNIKWQAKDTEPHVPIGFLCHNVQYTMFSDCQSMIRNFFTVQLFLNLNLLYLAVLEKCLILGTNTLS